MFLRRVKKTLVATCGATLALAGAGVALTTTAGATAPTNGSVIPGSAVAVGRVTKGTPFSSGQGINVVIPANTVLQPNQNVNILECGAPGGVPPTDPSGCDALTIQGPTLTVNSDGSVALQAETGTLYTVYALPDAYSLGESSGPATCDATHPCVLYVGQNQNDFTQPHFWSQPFYVTPTAHDAGTNPGDGSAPPSTPTITSASSDTNTVGQPFSFTVTTTGSPVPSISARGLPSGIKLVNNDNGTATISGTAASKDAGVYAATITAKNTQGTATQTFDLSEFNSPKFLSRSSTTTTAGGAFSYPISVSGYPVPTLTADNVPSGLTFTDNGDGTGTLSGTAPTPGGKFLVSLTAQNVLGTVAQTLTITDDQGPTITSAKSDGITSGVKMTNFLVTATGYPAPKVTLLSGTLPSGVKVVPSTGKATIEGTPATGTAGTYDLTFQAQVSSGTTVIGTVTQDFTLTVS
jgi:hypothetical protein